MKKLLGISLVAVLAATPMMASAGTPVAGEPDGFTGENEPTAQQITAVTATAEPYYKLAEANDTTDGYTASAGYVKGAYNAAIKAVNAVHAEAVAASNAATTAQTNAVSTANSYTDTEIGKLNAEVTQASGDNAVAVTITESAGKLTGVTANIAAGTVTKNALKADVQTSLGLADTAVQQANIATTLSDQSSNTQVAGALAVHNAISSAQTAAQGYADSLANNYDSAGSAAAAQTAAQGYADSAIGTATANMAEKANVVQTIKATTLTSTPSNFALTSGALTGNATVNIMTNWDNDTGTTLNVNTNTLAVNNLAVTGTVTTTINPASVSYNTVDCSDSANAGNAACKTN